VNPSEIKALLDDLEQVQFNPLLTIVIKIESEEYYK